MDEKLFYSKNKNGIRAITNSLVLKYWDGHKFGKWIFVDLPYKYASSPKDSENGVGDITLGLGPRGKIKIGRIGYMHYLSHLALTLPTGNSEGDITLGNGRYDIKSNLMMTYLEPGEKWEIDASLEYRLTGKNNKDFNPPNEMYVGLVGGHEIIGKMRLAGGAIDVIRGNKHLLNSRIVGRYTYSKDWHIEFVGEVGKEDKAGFQLRHNF